MLGFRLHRCQWCNVKSRANLVVTHCQVGQTLMRTRARTEETMVWCYAAAAEGDAMTDPCGSRRRQRIPWQVAFSGTFCSMKGLFVVQLVALFSTSLDTARNWFEFCTGLGARLQPEMDLISSSTFYLLKFTSKQSINNWIKIDQLDVTCFYISLFHAQHVSGVNTSILRSLQLICWVISWVVLLWFDVCWCYGVVWLGWCVVVSGCRLNQCSWRWM